MQNNTKGKAIASLVCGIVGLILAWFGYSAIASIILGIVAVVLGVQVRKFNDASKNLATGGLVTGVISIILGGICTVCVVCTVCTAGSLVALGSM